MLSLVLVVRLLDLRKLSLSSTMKKRITRKIMKVMHLIYFLRYFLFLIDINFVDERFFNRSQKITNQ